MLQLFGTFACKNKGGWDKRRKEGGRKERGTEEREREKGEGERGEGRERRGREITREGGREVKA